MLTLFCRVGRVHRVSFTKAPEGPEALLGPSACLTLILKPTYNITNCESRAECGPKSQRGSDSVRMMHPKNREHYGVAGCPKFRSGMRVLHVLWSFFNTPQGIVQNMNRRLQIHRHAFGGG